MRLKITLIETGYVGLKTGACLAEFGNQVLCFDLDIEKIQVLQKSGIPIYEPSLLGMLQRNVVAGRLNFISNKDIGLEYFSIGRK